MAAIWLRLRAEARGRWRAWLALALMFGVAAGASIAAFAGARRTHSAYPRFVRAQDAFDAVTGGGGANGFEERFAALKKHPMVSSFVEIVIVGPEVTIPPRKGRPEQVLAIPELIISTDPSGRAPYTTNRARVVKGRLANRKNAGETMVPFTVAERYGIEVGDRIVAGIGFSEEDFHFPLERVPLTVVGTYASPGDFEAVGQQSFPSIYVTPALYERFRDRLPPPNPDTWNLGLHLRGGSEAPARFKQLVEREFNLDVPVIEPVVRSGVQKTIRLYSVALWLLGGLIAAATVLVIGQTLSRQQLLDSAEYPALRALGVSRLQLVALGMTRALSIGAIAAAAAASVAYLLSPLAPIGPARVAEPNPGIALDVTAVGQGTLAVFLIVPLITLFPAWRAARAAARRHDLQDAGARPSRIVQYASRMSSSPATTAGLRMALEPGRGRTAVPVRSTILAVALGVAAVTGSLVVGRSMTHLIDTPALTGFTYDALAPGGDHAPRDDDARAALLRTFPFVERLVRGTGVNVVFDRVDSFLIAFDDRSEIGFALIEGRSPTDELRGGLPEIAVGPATARRLKLRVGGTVVFEYPDPAQAEEEQTAPIIERRLAKQEARIVGIAAIPPLPFAITEPGEGAMMTRGSVVRFNPVNQGGCCFVAFKEGTDLVDARKNLESVGFQVFMRTRRIDLVALERIGNLPGVLSAIFGLMAAGALAHVTATAVRRRRRDLAILKTLGFEKGQVRGAVAWQASAIAFLSVAVGVPTGLILGRWGWRLVAGYFGVVPVAVQPALLLLLILPIALVLANLVAALPGRIAARTQPALVLRTE